jgi:hypothetical protein
VFLGEDVVIFVFCEEWIGAVGVGVGAAAPFGVPPEFHVYVQAALPRES